MAAAAAYLCGATAEQIANGLRSFHGAGRRFEFLGTFDGVTVADDYAHHPTEIAATRRGQGMGYRKVWAVFQPFTFTRTARHLDGFVESLSAADRVILSDIMGSREENTLGVSSKQITDRIPGARYLPTFPGDHRLCGGLRGERRSGAHDGRGRCVQMRPDDRPHWKRETARRMRRDMLNEQDRPGRRPGLSCSGISAACLRRVISARRPLEEPAVPFHGA